MLNTQEQQELLELEKEFGGEAETSLLSPEEQVELSELEKEFGANPEAVQPVSQDGVAQGIPTSEEPLVEAQVLSPETDRSTISPDLTAMNEFDEALAREEVFLGAGRSAVLADEKDMQVSTPELDEEEATIAQEVDKSIKSQLYGKTAVHLLQESVGAVADGIIGPDTKKKLVKKYGSDATKIIKLSEAQQRQEFKIATDRLSQQIAPEVGKNVKPEWIQAIWMHESGNGNKVLGSTYNLGNIKATKSQKGKMFNVWEVHDGENVTVPAKFRTFNNFGEAAKAWAKFVQSSRYKAAREASTFEEFLEGLGSYATDPKWVAGVKKAHDSIVG